jgi:hypothetical protein
LISFIPAGEILFHLVVAFLHREQDGGLVLQREILEFEGLARADADARKLRPDLR